MFRLSISHFLLACFWFFEKLVNHSPAARDFQSFLVFSQHPAWVYHAGKLIEKAFFCLNRVNIQAVYHAMVYCGSINHAECGRTREEIVSQL